MWSNTTRQGFVSYTGDELEARLLIRLGGQIRILRGTWVERGVRRPEGRLEEISDFGETPKRGCVRVQDKSLFNKRENIKQTRQDEEEDFIRTILVFLILHQSLFFVGPND